MNERFIEKSILDIKTHYKPTETFQHTHFTSCHPLGVKRVSIKGKATRLLRTNSSKATFEECLKTSNEVSKHAGIQRMYTVMKIIAGSLAVNAIFSGCKVLLPPPCGANAQVITDQKLDMLKECDLEVRNFSHLSVKRVNKVLFNFHCICHRLALACADTGDSIKNIGGGKPPQGNVEIFWELS